MSEHDLLKWVRLALENHDLIDYNITDVRKGSKEHGFVGDIIFVTVSGKSKNNVDKTVDLVIKESKQSQKLRDQAPVKETFEKEIFIYDHVKTAFDKFQLDQGVTPLEIMPYCYATYSTDDKEVIILDNLAVQKFYLWDKTQMMTLTQIKMILEMYGKWHAISFALRKQRPQVFQQLTKDNLNMFSYFISKVKMLDYFFNLFEAVKKTVFSSDEVNILKNLQFSEEDVAYVLTDMLHEDPDYHVILHGDCWNNNFLFKYDENSSEASDLRIIDWQASGVSSPAIDLSHFIYACCDTGTHKNIEELLKIYHDSLSDYLIQLKCVPDEVFPFSKLMEHWRRFSSYGLMLSSYIIRACLCPPGNNPDWAESANQGKQFQDNFDYGVSDEDLYMTRVRNNLSHYAKNFDRCQ